MAKTIYDFEAQDLSGKTVPLSAYKGKVLLIVNTASKCGFTPQLDGMQKLYEKYKDQGFEILAFPSNQFAGQEPLAGEKIEEFCQVNYGVSFKVFAKGNVKGKDAQPLFHFLAQQTSFGPIKNYPVWNFQKYVINRKGEVVDYFNPARDPLSDRITETIEKCLKEKTA